MAGTWDVSRLNGRRGGHTGTHGQMKPNAYTGALSSGDETRDATKGTYAADDGDDGHRDGHAQADEPCAPVVLCHVGHPSGGSDAVAAATHRVDDAARGLAAHVGDIHVDGVEALMRSTAGRSRRSGAVCVVTAVCAATAACALRDGPPSWGGWSWMRGLPYVFTSWYRWFLLRLYQSLHRLRSR